jgi:hypothetical protein
VKLLLCAWSTPSGACKSSADIEAAPPVCSTVPIQIDAWARRRCLVLPTGLTCYEHIRDVFSRCSLNWVGRARLWGTNGGIRKTLA